MTETALRTFGGLLQVAGVVLVARELDAAVGEYAPMHSAVRRNVERFRRARVAAVRFVRRLFRRLPEPIIVRPHPATIRVTARSPTVTQHPSSRSSTEVGGLPIRRAGDWVQCRAMRRRCQRSSVSGVTILRATHAARNVFIGHGERLHSARSWGAQREAALAFGGGLIMAMAIAVSCAATGAAGAVRTLEQDPQVAKTLHLLEEGAGAGLVAALAAAVVAGLSIAALRLRSLPRWLPSLGIAIPALFAANALIGQTASLAIAGLLWVGLACATLAASVAVPTGHGSRRYRYTTSSERVFR